MTDSIRLALDTLDDIKTDMTDNQYKTIADGLGSNHLRSDESKKLYTFTWIELVPQLRFQEGIKIVIMQMVQRTNLLVLTPEVVNMIKKHKGRSPNQHDWMVNIFPHIHTQGCFPKYEDLMLDKLEEDDEDGGKIVWVEENLVILDLVEH